MTAGGAQQLLSRLALFRPGLHTDGRLPQTAQEPWHQTGNTPVRPTLFGPDLFMLLR